MPFDRSDRGNGCMRVIPGSDHAKSCEYEPVDERKAVYFELSPNECSLHDSRLVHGARG